MTKALIPGQSAPIQFEHEFVDGLKSIFEEKIVFNQLLGLKITLLMRDRVTARFDMRRELIGHYAHNRVHGGVIGAGLDPMGGLAVMAAIGARHMDETPQQRLQRFGKLGTIDLCVDYLRPGVSEYFEFERRGPATRVTRRQHTHGISGLRRQAVFYCSRRIHRLLTSFKYFKIQWSILGVLH